MSAIFRGVSLANTAMDCDYADRAHLTRSLGYAKAQRPHVVAPSERLRALLLDAAARTGA